jgi:hypothetical protein
MKFFEERIDDCQKAVWWNEIILGIQKDNDSPQDKIDATQNAIDTDSKTIEILKEKIKDL